MSGQDLVHGEDVQIEDVIYIIKDIQQFVHKIGQRTIIQVALEKDIRTGNNHSHNTHVELYTS